MDDLRQPEDPPRTFLAATTRIGPGLVLAGSIVGSGELIATTKVGATAGFTLLWLIVIGCVIKVFTQVELGRAAVSDGTTALTALDGLPGPRRRVSWAAAPRTLQSDIRRRCPTGAAYAIRRRGGSRC